MSAICPICPRACSLEDNQVGACGVRVARDDRVVPVDHGLLSAIHVDPIEKKPMHHFYPGCGALSLGSFGCNLMCRGCQNASISRSRAEGGFRLSPKRIVSEAINHNCPVVAYTYNEPIVWGEFVAETAQIVRAAGLKNVMVTAGYVTPETRSWLFENIDGANVDLKGFSDDFYKTWANGRLAPVLDTLEFLHNLPGFWLEITTLVVPGINDDPKMLEAEFAWIYQHLGPDVPVHLSAFHPAHKAIDIGCTPEQTLLMALRLAKDAGLHYIYLGNVPIASNTECPKCGNVLVKRFGYHTEMAGLKAGCCEKCGAKIEGRWSD